MGLLEARERLGAVMRAYRTMRRLVRSEPPDLLILIDFAEFKSTLERLLVYCSNNPTVGVLTAADEVMGNGDGEGN